MNPKTHTQLHLEDLEEQKAVDQNLLLNPKQVALMVRKEVALKKPRQGDGLALLKKRLLQNSEKDKNGCLNWKGRVNKAGYGRLVYHYQEILAHRASFILHGGELIGDKLWVLHSCHNPKCINPQHLRAGTHKENALDKIQAGRQLHGELVYGSKLTAKKVVQIRSLFSKGVCLSDLSNMFHVHVETIRDAVSRRTWKRVC